MSQLCSIMLLMDYKQTSKMHFLYKTISQTFLLKVIFFERKTFYFTNLQVPVMDHSHNTSPSHNPTQLLTILSSKMYKI